jgi:nucleoside 2-deoxyribosyltransferase
MDETRRGGVAEGKAYLLSAATRQSNAAGTLLLLNFPRIQEIVDRGAERRNPLDIADRLLVTIVDTVPHIGDPARISSRDYAIHGLRNIRELRETLGLLEQQGLITVDVAADGLHMSAKPTAAGWRRGTELRSTLPTTNQAFVAMSFYKELIPAWMDGIRPALRSVGYRGFRVDSREHNGKIDDVIIGELRRSAIVIADFTGHRAGVYFEAGYGMGRGLPVIWTCREDDVKQAHFDTRQYNHVVWNTPPELQERLRTRLLATIPVLSPLSGSE